MAAPTLKFYEFDTTGADPQPGGYVSPLGEVSDTSAGTLSFGIIDTDIANASATKVVVMRATDMGDNNFIRNLRFWGPDLIQAGLISYNAAIVAPGGWVQNAVMANFVQGGFVRSVGAVESTLPTTQNLFRADGNAEINGTGAAEASEWIYLNVDVSSSIGVGNYGGTNGQGILRYRVTFDYGK